ncbi:hypothetical protein QJS66_00725 [Kocuria rhizophila]|nr:hypothetical protein QJS66_00725 [Kocuria rhizophila]
MVGLVGRGGVGRGTAEVATRCSPGLSSQPLSRHGAVTMVVLDRADRLPETGRPHGARLVRELLAQDRAARHRSSAQSPSRRARGGGRGRAARPHPRGGSPGGQPRVRVWKRTWYAPRRTSPAPRGGGDPRRIDKDASERLTAGGSPARRGSTWWPTPPHAASGCGPGAARAGSPPGGSAGSARPPSSGYIETHEPGTQTQGAPRLPAAHGTAAQKASATPRCVVSRTRSPRRCRGSRGVAASAVPPGVTRSGCPTPWTRPWRAPRPPHARPRGGGSCSTSCSGWRWP